jgi:hypothetical protein
VADATLVALLEGAPELELEPLPELQPAAASAAAAMAARLR